MSPEVESRLEHRHDECDGTDSYVSCCEMSLLKAAGVRSEYSSGVSMQRSVTQCDGNNTRAPYRQPWT